MIGYGTLGAGALLLAITSGLGGYAHGLDTGKTRQQIADQKDVDSAIAARDRLRGQIEQAALLHLQADQARQSTHREIIRESTKIVDNPVYRNVCVDADGVRLLDRAIDNANAGHSGPPAQPAS